MRPPQLPEQPVEVVGPEHLARLLRTGEGRDFTSRRDTAIILLLVNTGMRRAECAGMTLDDVDLDQRIVWVLGKGRRPRALPIGPKTAQPLDRHVRVREGHRLAHLPHLWVGRNGPHDPVRDLPRPRPWSGPERAMPACHQATGSRSTSAQAACLCAHMSQDRARGDWQPSREARRAHPYQVSRATRCADRRFPRSPPSVRGERTTSRSVRSPSASQPRAGQLGRPGGGGAPLDQVVHWGRW